MKLTVAGNTKEYAAGITVSRLIEIEDVETPQYVSVSVNDEFVLTENFPTHVLNDGDSVEFLYYMGGGRAAPGKSRIEQGVIYRKPPALKVSAAGVSSDGFF